LKIGLKDHQLQFEFHKIRFPMTHFHYDRFDTPDDKQDGKWSSRLSMLWASAIVDNEE